MAAGEQAKYLRSYGRALKNTGDFASADQALQRSLALARGQGEGRNPTAAIALDEIGGLYFRQGKFEEARRYFEQAIELEKALYPEGHVTLARSLNNLANTYATLRRYEEAERIYLDAHGHYRRFLGENSAELATSLSNMAVCQQGAGRLKEAAATLEQVLAVHENNTGKERLPYWNTALKYANLRLEQNQAGEAARWAAQVVAALERMQPLPRIERGFARVVLAAALIETGRGREALVPAEGARKIFAEALAPKHWMRSYADAALAGAHTAHGRTAEAKALLEPLYQELADAQTRKSWRAAWIYKLARQAGL
ncbi:MAG: tetratricopeptide repeat protein [Bryobacterales bacterium]|nr:tetratricopeptide repeat protein [Bryobacterales bacterium]